MPLPPLSFDPDSYTDQHKLEMWESIHIKRLCPVCGAFNSFLCGPMALGSMNIECSPCRTIFWTTPFSQFGAYPVGHSPHYITKGRSLDDKNSHSG